MKDRGLTLCALLSKAASAIVGFAVEILNRESTMLRAQGKYLSEDEIKNIKRLLAITELSLQQIGTRMNCAKTTIGAINRKYGIRSYNGRRAEWMVNLEFLQPPAAETKNDWDQKTLMS